MNQPKKILYLVTQSDLGGAQRYVFDLANNLKDKYDVTVAAGPSQSEELFKMLANNQINYYKLKYLRRAINPLFDFWGLIELIKLIRKVKPDIVHLNSSKAGALGSLAAKIVGTKKIIYTVHGFVFLEPMSILKKKIYILIEKISANWKHYLITVSDNDRRVGIKYKITKADKLITINNGLEVDKINFLSKKQAKQILIKDNNLQNYQIVGTLANYYPTKGLEYLIAAAQQVIKAIPQVVFVLMGDGPARKQLEQQIKQTGLAKHFILGYQEQAVKYLKAFDVFVLASVKEGFPYAILEAMAAGLPIIASAVGGIPEMIQTNQSGILIKPKEADLLASNIISLLKDNNKRQQLGQNAYHQVQEKFSLSLMINRTEKVYQ